MDKKGLGARLRQVRDKSGMTQLEYSKKLGISNAAYSAYETGVNPIPLQVLDKVHDQYGVSIDWLMGYSDLKHGTNPITAGDRYRLLLRLHKLGIVDISAHEAQSYEDFHFMMIRVSDDYACRFIDEYTRLESLYREGVISETLFILGIAEQFSKLDAISSPDEKAIGDEPSL